MRASLSSHNHNAKIAQMIHVMGQTKAGEAGALSEVNGHMRQKSMNHDFWRDGAGKIDDFQSQFITQTVTATVVARVTMVKSTGTSDY